jgi:hypothetical protein
MTNDSDFFAKEEKEEAGKRERLFRQLTASPLATVVGVIDASGVGGGHSSKDAWWVLRFALAAWRIHGSGLRNEELMVQQRVAEAEVRRWMDRIDAYSIISFRAHLLDDIENSCPQALLVEFINLQVDDAELREVVRQLQVPVTFVDPDFGTFTLDRRVNLYCAETAWKGMPVRLNIDDNGPASVSSALEVARTLWRLQADWDARVRDFAVQELLSLKHEAWLDEDEAEVTPKEFKERMSIEDIAVRADGSFEFWYDDDDLFWGHGIKVEGTLNEGPTGADIVG